MPFIYFLVRKPNFNAFHRHTGTVTLRCDSVGKLNRTGTMVNSRLFPKTIRATTSLLRLCHDVEEIHMTNPVQKPSRERTAVHRDDDELEGLLSDRKDQGLSYKRLRQKWQVRWELLSIRSRRSVVLIGLCLLAFHFLHVWDYCFRKYRYKPHVNKDKQFAVVINTYKRPKQLHDAVQHYANVCGRRYGVGRVFIIWAEQEIPPPSFSDIKDTTLLRSSEANRSPVETIRVANSLNSRFLPIENLESEAIFMVDDDIRVDCASLAAAFSAWQSHPYSTVGFYPRLAEPSRRNTSEYVYHNWPEVFWRQQFNFILTKACFLHSRYLKMYSSDSHPQAIKDYVDKYFNCEDVAMSLLVANVTTAESGSIEASPIYVEASVTDKGLFNGISTGSGHMDRRSNCLTDLTAIYREQGWPAPLTGGYSLTQQSWVQHSPGFWWQQRPSNLFEWFALGNILKS